MKKESFIDSLRTLFCLVAVTIPALMYGQDGTGSGTGSEGGGGTTTTTSTTTVSVTRENWYAEPWVWVVGAAVLILLLVALLRGGSDTRTGRTERVTVTKSTSSDV